MLETNQQPRQLEEWYQRYGHVVFRRCLMLLHNQADALDMMQEVFMRVMKYGTSFIPDRKPLPWLFTIANRLCFDKLRLKQREVYLEIPSVQDKGFSLEQKTIMASWLQKFDRLTQEIVLGYYLEEMSLEEVASHVGHSRKTVSKKLQRFQKDVQERIQSAQP